MTELGTFEAAKVFDVSPATLLTLIAQGRLDAHRNEAGRWRIARKSLEAWNAKRLAKRAAARKNKRRRAPPVATTEAVRAGA